MSVACLDSLVGLSKTSIPCFTDTEPTGFADSTSGYHLTDADYGLQIAGSCSIPGWTLLKAARTQAILDFKTDLGALLRTEKRSALAPFSGLIGKLKSAGVSIPTKAFIGHAVTPILMRGGRLVIKGVHVGLNQTGDFTLKIGSTDPLFVTVEKTVSAVSGQFVYNAFDTAVEIPFWTFGGGDDDFKYFVGIERGTALPLANQFNCCGNTRNWEKYFYVSGLSSDDEIGTNPTWEGGAQGLSLDCYLSCSELDWICDLTELGGYNVLSVVARTIQFRGTAVAISALLNRQTVDTCTLYNQEQLVTKMNFSNQRFTENLQWLSQHLPDGVTDCFTCSKGQTFFKTTILS